MWVMQNDVLMELPDDVPMPPNSKKVDVPDEFLVAPRHFRVRDGALVHEPRKTEPLPKFTLAEIAFLKQLVTNRAIPKEKK